MQIQGPWKNRRWYWIGAGLVFSSLLAGAIWFGFIRKKPELTVLLEANGVIDRFVQDHNAQLAWTTGLQLHVKTFHPERMASEPEAMKAFLEAGLVIASAETLADWQTKGWLTNGKSLPLFAWGRPYAVSMQKDLSIETAIDSLKLPKPSGTARFSATFATDQPRFLVNLLVNAGALQLQANKAEALVWNADRLLETLSALSKAVHEDLTAPVSCVIDCPLAELLRGNAAVAWVDSTRALHMHRDLEKAQLQPIKGPSLVQIAHGARLKLSSESSLKAAEALIVALQDAKLSKELSSMLLEPLSPETIGWDPSHITDGRKFEFEISTALLALLEGQTTAEDTRNRLLQLAHTHSKGKFIPE